MLYECHNHPVNIVRYKTHQKHGRDCILVIVWSAVDVTRDRFGSNMVIWAVKSVLKPISTPIFCVSDSSPETNPQVIDNSESIMITFYNMNHRLFFFLTYDLKDLSLRLYF